MKTVKQITKIKLKDNGLKGAEVTYIHPQEKNGMIFSNEHVEKRKHPIHTDFENHINELRNFLLDTCGFYTGELTVSKKDYLISECRVIGIEIKGADRFKIIGELRTIGDKPIKLTSPEVEEIDNYEYFSTVMHIIKSIVLEAHEYMAGRKKLEDHEFLAKFAKKTNDEVLIKEMKDMSKKEVHDWCIKILEKQGALVLVNEEIDVEGIDLQLDLENATEVGEPEPLRGVIHDVDTSNIKSDVLYISTNSGAETGPVVIPIQAQPEATNSVPVPAPQFVAPAF